MSFPSPKPYPHLDAVTTVDVVGMTFLDDYPENVLALWREEQKNPFDNHDRQATLRRNPANPHDPNAIEVHIGGEMFGHLPRDVAADFAPALDQGVEVKVTAWTRVDQGHMSNPGLSVRIEVGE